MQVLVIGQGGREHALCWKLRASQFVSEVYCAPGNPGTSQVAVNVPVNADDLQGLVDFACRKKIDLTVVGPEQPLMLGVADAFRNAGLHIFGPSQQAAQLEGSKDFAKKIMRAAGVPTANYVTFRDQKSARDYILEHGVPIVIKADGLAAGKGVFVCQSFSEAEAALETVFHGFGQSAVVVEDFLSGKEASFIVVTDGERVYPLATSHDYKRVGDGDEGPNTGGMGAVSPTPHLTTEQEQWVVAHVVRPVLEEMRRRGTPFSGFLYAGLMIDEQGGIRVLEFNVRCGDPETQVILRRMPGDLCELLYALAAGKPVPSTFKCEGGGAAVCVVLAAEGYPQHVIKGDEIFGLDEADELPGVVVFHAGTAQDAGQRLCTKGGRVLCVSAEGREVEEARRRAYEAVRRISFRGMHYRSDIGQVNL